MHRIDVPSATVDEKFTEGSPTGGIPATVVAADWLNDLQENVAVAIETAGLPLTKGRSLDLYDAIGAIAAGLSGSGVGLGSVTSSGWFEIVYKDFTTLELKKIIIMYGLGSTDADGVVKLNSTPVAFPNHFYRVIASDGVGSPSGVEPVAAEPVGLGTFNAVRSGGTGSKGFNFIAIGD